MDLQKEVNDLCIGIPRESQTVKDTGVYDFVLEAAFQISIEIACNRLGEILGKEGLRLVIAEEPPG